MVSNKVTISSQIRDLNKLGLTRSEIATKLNIRYQHVRNVLVNDSRKVPSDNYEI